MNVPEREEIGQKGPKVFLTFEKVKKHISDAETLISSRIKHYFLVHQTKSAGKKTEDVKGGRRKQIFHNFGN
jgi:hypothetical protein